MQKKKKVTTNFKELKEEELYIIRGGEKRRVPNFTSVVVDIARFVFGI